ncbi:activator of basal transcription 1-like [Neodiprion fabricii]|uniref:activator of basal transcription 1-like n=1 Tax=Neodiprion fabricii TaxID=2872261 RepID=UPI001ED92A48|nr:activator of basal transcription 1-like [Neodiprion fabricii]
MAPEKVARCLETDDENDSDKHEIESEGNDNDENSVTSEVKHESISKPRRKKKRGIIYLSTIPKFMNVTKVREIFSEYGEIGRVYLQPDIPKIEEGKKQKKKKTPFRHFTEGWIEFESKKVAKHVAATLNNKQIDTRKKSKFYDLMWNIKYLPRFKWIHLSERLAYERAVHKQRLRTEIAQAKREANFFSYNVDMSKKLKRKREAGEAMSNFEIPNIKQRDTDMEIRKKKNANNQGHQSGDRAEFIESLFS